MEYAGRTSVALDARSVASYHAVLLATDHSSFDYAMIARSAKLIVDSRNGFGRRGLAGENIIKA